VGHCIAGIDKEPLCDEAKVDSTAAAAAVAHKRLWTVKVYPHHVAWKGVGEDTEKSYSACLRKISQKASRKKNILCTIT
jgi:hypothetical protein